MILTFSGERKRIVYEGEKIGRAVLLIKPGRVLGYHETPEGERVPIGEWEDLEAAYRALDEWLIKLVDALGLREEEEEGFASREERVEEASEWDPQDDEPPF